MAPGNNERHSSHSGHTGTIPKTKARNNFNVPQEAVTPTRRDMTTNLASTSLDWVPVSEYNTRGNYNQQSRKPRNNTSDHELTDLDNSVSYESGFGRFVPVRPQPRALPLNVQNQNITGDFQEDVGSSSASGQMLHPYAHQMQNGLNQHNNHTAAAVMIVNPTTPNAVSENINQPYNAPHQNRNNLTRNINSARNNLEGNSHMSNNNTSPPTSNSRAGRTKSVNLMNNMYDPGQGSLNNINDNHVQIHRESARTLGEAIVAACPDAAAVERRLGQIREYIRVTSSLVDTMRNSEDEAFIEHTREEYDELVEMVMKLKESESKLEKILTEKEPENIEVPADENQIEIIGVTDDVTENKTNVNTNDSSMSLSNSNLKKVTNLENEQLNKSLQIGKVTEEKSQGSSAADVKLEPVKDHGNESDVLAGRELEKQEEGATPAETDTKQCDQHLNELLRQNILACVEKVALIEDLKNKKDNYSSQEQEVVVRPVSVQSNGSAYSENDLWQNEIKNKMEMSQLRLTSLKQQQKRLLKYQEEAKQQLEDMTRDRQSQEMHNPSTSHENFGGMQSQPHSSNYNHSNRMYTANQIGVATTLPHSMDSVHEQQNIESNMDGHLGHSSRSIHCQEEQFSHRETNVASSEEAGGGRDSEAEEDESLLGERARLLQMKLRELQMKKQHMENLVTEFQKLQMATRGTSSQNTYSSSGEDSGVEESSCKFAANKQGGSIKNDDPFKLMEIKAIKQALQKTKDLMRSVENYESEHIPSNHDDSYQISCPLNIHDNKSEGGGSAGGWSEGSVCRVRNALQPHKLTNSQHQHQPHRQPPHLHHNHPENIAALQELSQELRMETEKIIGERTRIKDMIANKELARKQKKVNEECGAGGGGGGPGPAERRQMQLRALLAEKQRELEALIRSSNEKDAMSLGNENQNQRQGSRAASNINQSYTSEQEEPESRSEQNTMESQNLRDDESYRGGAEGSMRSRTINTLSSHVGSAYGSDSDSAARGKSNQRNRMRRRQTQDRLPEECISQASNQTQNTRLETRAEQSNINMVPPISQNENPGSGASYPPYPPCWDPTKTNQDMRNQFTQNSHSQTMERLLGTPQMSFSPSMPPFNLMMPYGKCCLCTTVTVL